MTGYVYGSNGEPLANEYGEIFLAHARSERTCNLVEDGDLLHCSECGGAAEERLWAYWHYCPNCGAKVMRVIAEVYERKEQ